MSSSRARGGTRAFEQGVLRERFRGGVRSNPLRRSVHQLREAVMFMR